MRQRRLRVRGRVAWYHAISRVVAGERLLGPEEKAVLRKWIFRAAGFCGVEVVTYAILDNHFHLLVRVPLAPEEISDAEIIRRFRLLYGERSSFGMPRAEVLVEILRNGGTEASKWRKRLLARMHDLSAFMATVKQRFAVWYNRTHGRFGTLWAERFKSVLVEGSPAALSTVAAYIDLNPVRAGLVSDPAEYHWCGYAEAVAGRSEARDGIRSIFHRSSGEPWSTVMASYRVILFGRGGQAKAGAARIEPDRVRAVLANGGELPPHEALRCRIRYFSDGVVLGGGAFVRRFLEGRGKAPPDFDPPLVGSGEDLRSLARLRGQIVG